MNQETDFRWFWVGHKDERETVQMHQGPFVHLTKSRGGRTALAVKEAMALVFPRPPGPTWAG
jgi:hypothetical protein